MRVQLSWQIDVGISRPHDSSSVNIWQHIKSGVPVDEPVHHLELPFVDVSTHLELNFD